jgi:hypothetical protein
VTDFEKDDVGERAQRRDQTGRARLRADARGGDGGVREKLAARMIDIARLWITDAGRQALTADGRAKR